jgi:transcriptional regulator of met regulon
MKHDKIALENEEPGLPGVARSLPPINPPHGGKGDFRKITVTLPQQAYQQLIQESARRKIAGESNQLLSDLLREAVTDYLTRLAS